MKKSIFTGLILGLLVLSLSRSVRADCISCNDFLDNGHCDKSDMNNKFCTSGMPKDCYTGSCKPGDPIQ